MMKSGPKILVFIPMYNCEKQIVRVLSHFTPEVQNLFTEILIIDNKSQDQSVDSAKSSISQMKEIKVTLIQNKENVSLGGSHKVAFNYALEKNYDFCVVLHGDDQGNINDFIPFRLSGEFMKYDAFLGGRFSPNSKLIGYSKFSILGNLVFNFILSLSTRTKIYDLGSGLNCYKLDFLKKSIKFQK